MLKFIFVNAVSVGWKRTFIVWISVILISFMINSILTHYFHQLTLLIRTIILSSVMVPAILWIIIPAANKILKNKSSEKINLGQFQ